MRLSFLTPILLLFASTLCAQTLVMDLAANNRLQQLGVDLSKYQSFLSVKVISDPNAFKPNVDQSTPIKLANGNTTTLGAILASVSSPSDVLIDEIKDMYAIVQKNKMDPNDELVKEVVKTYRIVTKTKEK